MRPGKPKLTALWHALDEASFGTDGTLNLRELLPTVAEARQRTEVWLRARQMTKSKQVLVITGRGNQSAGGIGLIRQEILRILPSLRRSGVVESWREHSPGSIVIQRAPMSALFEAPRRRRGNAPPAAAPSSAGLEGLQPETLRLLRQIASHNLHSLGVEQTPLFLEEEMLRTFSKLISAIPQTGDREFALREAIVKAIEEGAD
jgi:hypothetical protein